MAVGTLYADGVMEGGGLGVDDMREGERALWMTRVSSPFAGP